MRFVDTLNPNPQTLDPKPSFLNQVCDHSDSDDRLCLRGRTPLTIRYPIRGNPHIPYPCESAYVPTGMPTVGFIDLYYQGLEARGLGVTVMTLYACEFEPL